jgi:hypothetical protein
LLAAKADKGMTLDLSLRMKEDVLSKRYDVLAEELAEVRERNKAVEAANRGREHELAIRSAQHEEKVANLIKQLKTDFGVADGHMRQAEEELTLWEGRRTKAVAEEHDNSNTNKKSRGKSRVSLSRNSKLAKSSIMLTTGPEASRLSLGLQKSISMYDVRRRASIKQPTSPTPRRHKSTTKSKRKQAGAYSDAAKTVEKLFERRKTATATQKTLEVVPLQQHQLKKMLTIMNKSRTSRTPRIDSHSKTEIPKFKNMGIDDIMEANKIASLEKDTLQKNKGRLNETEAVR